jgi:hypothetical protein
VQVSGEHTPSGDAGAPNIVFASDIVPNTPGGDGIIHENESFQVQWAAQNIGTAASPAFTDLLVISSVPEGCPGDDNKDHPVVYNSERDAENPQDFLEGALNPTLAKNISNTTLFTCIDIIAAS